MTECKILIEDNRKQSELKNITFSKFEKNKVIAEEFIYPMRKNTILLPNQSLIGPSQSLFFQNF